MEENLDLTNAKWTPSNEVYLYVIKQSLHENYPQVNIDWELQNNGYTYDDLLDDVKLKEFLEILEENYPE